MFEYYSETIIDAKDEFLNRISVKLDNPNTSAKSYWSIVSNFLNNKKIATVPPLLFNGALISNCKQKSGLFSPYVSINVQRLIHLVSYPCLLIRRKTT